MASAFLVDKGNHRHFMAKEIHEQPEVVARTLAHYLDMSAGRVALPFELPASVAKIDKLTIIACGTAYMAGLTAKYWFETLRPASGDDRGRLGVSLRRGADDAAAA